LFAPYRPTRYFAADSKNVIAKIKSLFFLFVIYKTNYFDIAIRCFSVI